MAYLTLQKQTTTKGVSQIPYKSKAMQGYFHTHKKEIGPKVVAEFDKASKGQHDLPEHPVADQS